MKPVTLDGGVIDWTELWEQKLDLLNIRVYVKELTQRSGHTQYMKWYDSLSGIIHFLDYVQDTAVYDTGYTKKEVWDFPEEDEA